MRERDKEREREMDKSLKGGGESKDSGAQNEPRHTERPFTPFRAPASRDENQVVQLNPTKTRFIVCFDNKENCDACFSFRLVTSTSQMTSRSPNDSLPR